MRLSDCCAILSKSIIFLTMKKLYISLLLASVSLFTTAQTEATFKPFNNLDLSVSAGTTGLGLDLATKITPIVQVRAGFHFMPEFEPKMNFGIEGGRYDANGNWVTTRFESMADKMQEFTGFAVDSSIDMVGTPNFNNLSLMVDVFPFTNKHWHVSAGVFYGSAGIADACNAIEDMPSLLAVGIYNNMYNKILTGQPVIGDDIYLTPEIEDKFLNMGRMGIRMGDYVRDVVDDEGKVVHKAGEPYIMEPDENSLVRASIEVNRWRPYLGFGYEGALFKRDPSYRISFDCGAMFWGGTPSLITHDGTDLVKDVCNVRGKVGRYVDAISKLDVMPVLNVRITKQIF